MANQMLVIAPYFLDEAQTWVFDDEQTSLVQEPFVQGVPEMIDDLVADIPGAKDGFRLIFSPNPFPNYQRQLVKLREEYGGTWYEEVATKQEGWLCAALFEYFDVAPENIYIKAERKSL